MDLNSVVQTSVNYHNKQMNTVDGFPLKHCGTCRRNRQYCQETKQLFELKNTLSIVKVTNQIKPRVESHEESGYASIRHAGYHDVF